MLPVPSDSADEGVGEGGQHTGFAAEGGAGPPADP